MSALTFIGALFGALSGIVVACKLVLLLFEYIWSMRQGHQRRETPSRFRNLLGDALAVHGYHEHKQYSRGSTYQPPKLPSVELPRLEIKKNNNTLSVPGGLPGLPREATAVPELEEKNGNENQTDTQEKTSIEPEKVIVTDAIELDQTTRSSRSAGGGTTDLLGTPTRSEEAQSPS
eukprot:TRINITY_DN58092_c0_g1_i2.p1 TRINITY_DN58092_c0_g1~~TRINITY_DN58092_c0_g1_i2.p1  ORF type:complete len:176 (+),score=3.59 TRINITY_DN58092_c0_g1_i2:170-697(+)